MPKYQIQIKDITTDQITNVETDGVVLLYLDQGKIRVTGMVEFSELVPYLAKPLMDKLMK